VRVVYVGNELYYKFWSSFFALDKGETVARSNAKPTERGSVSLGYNDGLAYYYVVKRSQTHVAFYIARPDARENKRIFDELISCKEEIENFFGAPFIWKFSQ
jgi:hypothetical protein